MNTQHTPTHNTTAGPNIDAVPPSEPCVHAKNKCRCWQHYLILGLLTLSLKIHLCFILPCPSICKFVTYSFYNSYDAQTTCMLLCFTNSTRPMQEHIFNIQSYCFPRFQLITFISLEHTIIRVSVPSCCNLYQVNTTFILIGLETIINVGILGIASFSPAPRIVVANLALIHE